MAYIGIDIGGTTIKAGLVSDHGTLLTSIARPSPVDDLSRLIVALSSIVEMLIIDGGASEAGSWLIDSAIEEARERASTEAFEVCRIVRTKLGSDAGIIGAA